MRVVCGAFCLGDGIWVRAFFSKRFISQSGCVGAEGCGCVRDSATVSKGSRPDDADGNPVLLVRQRHGGVQLAWGVFVVGKQTEIWRGRWGRLQN